MPYSARSPLLSEKKEGGGGGGERSAGDGLLPRGVGDDDVGEAAGGGDVLYDAWLVVTGRRDSVFPALERHERNRKKRRSERGGGNRGFQVFGGGAGGDSDDSLFDSDFSDFDDEDLLVDIGKSDRDRFFRVRAGGGGREGGSMVGSSSSSSVAAAASPRGVSSLDELPDEALMTVLEFLDRGSLLSCTLVSRRFYALASDDHLWKTFFFDDFGGSAMSRSGLSSGSSAASSGVASGATAATAAAPPSSSAQPLLRDSLNPADLIAEVSREEARAGQDSHARIRKAFILRKKRRIERDRQRKREELRNFVVQRVVRRWSWLSLFVFTMIFLLLQTFFSVQNLYLLTIGPGAVILLLGSVGALLWRNAGLEKKWLFHLFLTTMLLLMVVVGFPLLYTLLTEAGPFGDADAAQNQVTNAYGFGAWRSEAMFYTISFSSSQLSPRTFFDPDFVLTLRDPRELQVSADVVADSISQNTRVVCMVPWLSDKNEIAFWAACPSVTVGELEDFISANEYERYASVKSEPPSYLAGDQQLCWKAAMQTLGDASDIRGCIENTVFGQEGQTAVSLYSLATTGRWFFSMGETDSWTKAAASAKDFLVKKGALKANTTLFKDAPIIRWGSDPSDFEGASTGATVGMVLLFVIPLATLGSSWKYFRSQQ